MLYKLYIYHNALLYIIISN